MLRCPLDPIRQNISSLPHDSHPPIPERVVLPVIGVPLPRPLVPSIPIPVVTSSSSSAAAVPSHAPPSSASSEIIPRCCGTFWFRCSDVHRYALDHVILFEQGLGHSRLYELDEGETARWTGTVEVGDLKI